MDKVWVICSSGDRGEALARPLRTSGHEVEVVIAATDLPDTVADLGALRGMALTDPLTGLPNRRLLDDRLRQALARARRDAHQVAVLFLDLVDFKGINDTRGHAEGDRVLVELATRLEQTVRASDTVARWGGDEFAMVLPGIETEGDLEAVFARVTAATDAVGVDVLVGRAMGTDEEPAALLLRAQRDLERQKDPGGHGRRGPSSG